MKTITLFLTLLIGLMFSNASFAILGQTFYPDRYRCKVTYSKFNLMTNLESTRKITNQGHIQYLDWGNEDDTFYNVCYWGADGLADKIEVWQKKHYTNIVTGLTPMFCKIRTESWFNNLWSPYRNCDEADYTTDHGASPSISHDLSDLEKHSLQIGYNVNKDE